MSKFSKYIRFLIAFKLILINGIAQIESQNFYEEYKNRTLKEVSYSFIDERLKLMKDFSDVSYCIKGKEFTNIVKSPTKESAVITIKISDENVFVFYFLNLLENINGKLTPSKQIFSGLYLISNGYIEETSIKFFYIDRKEIRSNGKLIREEIWFDEKFYFILENQAEYKKMIFPNKVEIPLQNKQK